MKYVYYQCLTNGSVKSTLFLAKEAGGDKYEGLSRAKNRSNLDGPSRSYGATTAMWLLDI